MIRSVRICLILTIFCVNCKKDPAVRPKNRGLKLVKLVYESRGGWSAGTTWETTYEYDASGRLTRMVEAGSPSTYFYKNDLLDSVAGRRFGIPYAYKLSYDGSGRVERCVAYAPDGKVSTEHQYEYSANNQLIKKKHKFSWENSFTEEDYEWMDGNVVSVASYKNGTYTGGYTLQATKAFNPNRLLPAGMRPWEPMLMSKNWLVSPGSWDEIKVDRHSSGYPGSINFSKGGMFGKRAAYYMEYQKF